MSNGKINPDLALIEKRGPFPGDLRWVRTFGKWWNSPSIIRLERYEWSHTDNKMDWYTVDTVES